MIGQTVSHYRIVEKLGEGGMGVVYKAEDTKLERTVALKFLAAHLLHDGEAKQRFLREAKSAAALHHPNICTVHEVDEADGKTFLAMAFLEGQPLEDRIAQGPLPIKDALDIARQVADGLEAAHAKGIVHRDIKPANILVSPEGRATILDFGLARLTEASKLTRADQTVGTVAYMSPEQIQGSEVDSRTDIWALGCVLYEMIAGVRPFQGQYDQALAYEIVNQEAEPLTGVRAGVPLELEFIVGKCLAKDREDRTGAAQEVARELRTLAEKLKSGRSTILRGAQMTGAIPAAMTGAHTVNPAAALPPDAMVVRRGRQRVLQVVAIAATLAFLGVLAVLLKQTPPERSVARFSFSPEGLGDVRISPDGRYILYVAETDAGRSLWLRALNDESARELPGTEGATDGFWSPDSASIGFAVFPGNQLKRVAIEGGIPITLCKLPQTAFPFIGGTWSPDGERMAFSSGFKLYEVPARGGQPQLLLDRSSSPRPNLVYPEFLPAGRGPAALVYRAASAVTDGVIAVLNLETGEHREFRPGTRPVFSEPGYLIHGPASTGGEGLWALPFSLAKLEPTGEAFPITPAGTVPTVSNDGTLVYRSQVGSGFLQIQTLVWRNRAGELLETAGQPQLDISQVVLSPDGRRVAVRSSESGSDDIWVHDLSRNTKTRLTFDALGDQDPAWSPNGGDIVYRLQGTPNRIMRRPADGTGEPEVLVESRSRLTSPDWSRDGRYLVYAEVDPESGRGIRYVKFGADGKAGEPATFVGSPDGEWNPRVSPDGRFVAYESNESGRVEIYVRPFPGGEGKWQASVNGGTIPRWRNDGGELYYVEGARLMAVSVSTDPVFALGQPQRLFESPGLTLEGGESGYDVSADGQRFLTVAPTENAAAPDRPAIRIVQNWYEEFRDREGR